MMLQPLLESVEKGTEIVQLRGQDKHLIREMLLTKHYAQRMPQIKFAFALLVDGSLRGCVTYGIPASYTLCNGVCGAAYRKQVLELSRLVIDCDIPNSASMLIGSSLKMLPSSPWVVVSYADPNVGHVGYVYQATNWIYTGTGNAEPIWVHPENGQIVSKTRRHIDVKAAKLGLTWQELIKRPQLGKHRYVTFAGNRAFKCRALASLKYSPLPYPKGNTRRFDYESG